MQCHWTEKTMEFDDNGTSVKLQGIQQQEQFLQELSADQLVKCWKGKAMTSGHWLWFTSNP